MFVQFIASLLIVFVQVYMYAFMFHLLSQTSVGFFKISKLLRTFWDNGSIFTCCK